MSERKTKVSSVFAVLTVLCIAAAASCDRRTDDGGSSTEGNARERRRIDRRELDDAFLTALRDHPRTEISQDLHASIMDGSITYTYVLPGATTGAGVIEAAFFVLHGPQLDPPQDAAVMIPIIYVRPQIVVDAMRDSSKRRWLQTVLYHEYQHYLQWKKAGADGREMFMFRPADANLSRTQCLKHWHHELDAYLAECELVKAQAWETKRPELCQAYGDPARFKASLNLYLRNGIRQTGHRECASVWDEAAR